MTTEPDAPGVELGPEGSGGIDTPPSDPSETLADRDHRRLSPAERTLRARAAAYRLHSLHDSRELTANARAAFNDRFARQVDPDGLLPRDERQRRAECARKAYYAALAAKSARARRLRSDGAEKNSRR
jgi:hypothetical protein